MDLKEEMERWKNKLSKTLSIGCVNVTKYVHYNGIELNDPPYMKKQEHKLRIGIKLVNHSAKHLHSM